MEIHAIQTPVIKAGDDLVSTFVSSLESSGLALSPGDIVVVAETVVATAQGRIVDLQDVTGVPEGATVMAKKYNMDPRLVKVVMDESDDILGGVDHVVLTRKDGLLLANAGIDASNAGGGTNVCLLPRAPWDSIRAFRAALERASNVHPLGAILADSRVQPLKRGVIGGALAVSGFHPVLDKRGQKDLFGRTLLITQIAVADDLTSAAEIMMGEADEQTPFVLIKGAPVTFVDDDQIDNTSMLMPESECLFMGIFKEYVEKNSR